MHKTVTLRLKDDVYKIFAEIAKAENRSLSNLIETAALKNVREQQFVDDIEMAEIMSNAELLKSLKEGCAEAHALPVEAQDDEHCGSRHEHRGAVEGSGQVADVVGARRVGSDPRQRPASQLRRSP